MMMKKVADITELLIALINKINLINIKIITFNIILNIKNNYYFKFKIILFI